MAAGVPTSLNLTNQQKEKILSKIMADVAGRNSLKKFLASEYSEENLLFLEDVDKYETAGPGEMADIGERIYELYIASNSDREVNLPAPVMKPLRKNLGGGSPVYTRSTFVEAKEEMRKNLKEDCLLRFMQSEFYSTYVKALEGEREREAKRKGSTPSPGNQRKKGPSAVGADDDGFDSIVSLMLEVHDELVEEKEKAAAQDILGHFEMEETSTQSCNDLELFLASGFSESEAEKKRRKEKEEKKKAKAEKKAAKEKEAREKKEKKREAKAEAKGESPAPPTKAKSKTEMPKPKKKRSMMSPFKRKTDPTKKKSGSSLTKESEDVPANTDDANDDAPPTVEATDDATAGEATKDEFSEKEGLHSEKESVVAADEGTAGSGGEE